MLVSYYESSIAVGPCSNVFPITLMGLVKIIFVSKFVMIGYHCYSVKSCAINDSSISNHSPPMVFEVVYRGVIVVTTASDLLWAMDGPHAAPAPLTHRMSVIIAAQSNRVILMRSVAEITRL
jgi:hypothetical protein